MSRPPAPARTCVVAAMTRKAQAKFFMGSLCECWLSGSWTGARGERLQSTTGHRKKESPAFAGRFPKKESPAFAGLMVACLLVCRGVFSLFLFLSLAVFVEPLA